MESSNDHNIGTTRQLNNFSRQVETQFFFYDNGKLVVASINAEFIAKLQLTRHDKATQEIVTTPLGPGILILPKRSKNGAAGSCQTNPADDSMDRLPSYHSHEHV